jgi:hypothetical protein
MLRIAVLVALTSLAAAPALTQSHQPYAGLETRALKALSADQIADLKAGRGMGLALAAELNGYPGPLHVLELADRINLSHDQRATGSSQAAASRRRACRPRLLRLAQLKVPCARPT